MEIIDLFEKICDYFEKLFEIDIPDSIPMVIVMIIGMVTLCVYAYKFIKLVYTKIRERIRNPWRQEQINKILLPDYADQLEDQTYFIPTKFTTTPPHNLEDPSEVERTESAKRLIDFFLDNILIEKNTTNRYYCILAGAGMGKTTWTVNLVTSYINKYTRGTCPFDIKLISLAHKDFADSVNTITKPNKTILILDALDENAEASREIEVFMRNLENIIYKFRFVILTSRTQFFPSEGEEPHKTSILKLSGDKGTFVYHRMYISPFAQEDVDLYLKKKYTKRKLRKRATAIIEQCESLATRPLLLSHLDDLLDGTRSYSTISDIYGALIDAWIKREVRFATGEENDELCRKLYDFSLNFALELFANREQSTNMRMCRSQYEEFINTHNYTDYDFKGRSLINRDAEGTIKFSHKTFYEYFLAKAKFANPDIEIPNSGYELAWTFYDQLVYARLREIPSSRMTMIHPDTILCLRRLGQVNFDYRWFERVKNIKRVGVVASIFVNNTDNFTTWLVKSSVQIVDIIGYRNDNLKKLLNVATLKEVNILYVTKLSTKGRQQMRKLEEKGIIVTESQLRTYPNYDTVLYYRGNNVISENVSLRLLQESYEEFLRTQETTMRYLAENISINILDETDK